MTTISRSLLRVCHFCGWTAVIVICSLLTVTPSVAQQSLHKWEFSEDPGGWLAANSVAPLIVRDRRLIVKVVGFDPFIYSSRSDRLDIQGSSDQFIRMVARCNVEGSAEFFWASSTEGEESGFQAGKEMHFTLHGDGRREVLFGTDDPSIHGSCLVCNNHGDYGAMGVTWRIGLANLFSWSHPASLTAVGPTTLDADRTLLLGVDTDAGQIPVRLPECRAKCPVSVIRPKPR